MSCTSGDFLYLIRWKNLLEIMGIRPFLFYVFRM